MAEAQSFELLKTKRKSLRTAVTKVVNELEAEFSNSDLNVDMLSEMVETLRIKFEPLTLVDQQMEPPFKPEEFDGEFEITEKYREKVLLWQFRAKKINEFLKPRVTSPSLQTTLSQSQDEHFQNTDNIRIQVPKYITRFYGDHASKWLTFWNSFETAVHNNESLNKVDKFNYLKAHLGGSALNTVEGFPISAKAYDEAVELLKNRFANSEILIQAHMNEILSLLLLKNSNDLRSFRKFVDNSNVQLRILELRSELMGLHKLNLKDLNKWAETILLERRQTKSVGRWDSRSTFLRSDWPRPFARRKVGVEMDWVDPKINDPRQGPVLYRSRQDDRLRRKISNLWELDSLGIKDPSEKKSKLELQDLALKHFENTVLRDDEGRYIVSIPWIEGNEKLEIYYSLSKGRLEKTEKTLKFTGRLFDYEQVFVNWEKEGIIEKIAQDEPKNGGKFHYLPRRPVFKENSPTKIRPVLDGSAHHGKSCSLNDCVEKGPNLIEMMPAILNRFRLGKIGVISDIRKSFLSDIFA
ncbi:DUF1758 domain-containing protein [Trichonephila clavipes]|nr:DUF1758 domain-containing protein [Trichonephila clavipes]